MELQRHKQPVKANRNKQAGLALYLMLVFAMLISVELISVQLSAEKNHYKTERQQRIKSARENLIALAVNYADNYGPSGAGPLHLPCPNRKTPDGSRSSEGPDTPCNGEHFIIGRLPRLVGITHRQRVLNYQPDQYDAQNALWYAVSADFVNSPFKQLNSEASSRLTFNGIENVVAVVFDAGPPIGEQAGMRPGTDLDAYLELSIKASNLESSDQSNDRFLVITSDELIATVSARVGLHVSAWLREYRNRNCTDLALATPCFPWAAEQPDGQCVEGLREGWISVEAGGCAQGLFQAGELEGVPRWAHWFIRNNWFEHIRYQVDEACLGALSLDCDIRSETLVYEGLLRPMLTVAPRL